MPAWMLKLAPVFAPMLGIPGIVVEGAKWAASRSDFLKPRIERWQKLFPGAGTFNGPAVEKAIDAYEPTAYEIAEWYKRKEKFLLPIIRKWRALYGGGKPSFDGDAFEELIRKWEPIAFEAATLHKGGMSLLKACYTAWMGSAGPKWNEF